MGKQKDLATKIIEDYAKLRKVELLASRYRKLLGNDYEDFCQDMYLILLLTKPELICKLVKEEKLDAWVTKVMKIEIFSNTSPFARVYCRDKKFIPLDVYIRQLENEENELFIQSGGE